MPSGLGIVAILLAILLAVGFATDGAAPPLPPPAAPLAVIAKRVERLRGVRFEHVPKPLTVSPAQARAEGLADLERGYPAAARRADEALYTTLGLIPRGTDLKKVSASLFGEQVAGYYDPRTGRLRVVDGPAAGNRVLAEITLAHELNHALEDQAFGIDTEVAEASGDRGYAYRALVEGSATAVMLEYAGRYFKADEALAGLLSSAFTVTSTTPLPPFVQAGFTWPYLGGQRFVADLYGRARRSWTLVDLALKARPPSSTEQVLHPEKWLAVEEPETVRLRGIERVLGAGWTLGAEGTFGEWQTGELLALGGRRRPNAAAGWGGDRYELWQKDGQSAVAIRWRWDTEPDAREFAEAMQPALGESALPMRLAARGRETAVVVGPGTRLVQRVAAAIMA